MPAPWRKAVVMRFSDGGRFWHLGVLMENGNIQKGIEKDGGSDTR